MSDQGQSRPNLAGGQFLVWVAQGFGFGRLPAAPGTWGSVLGVVWYWLLLAWSPGSVSFFVCAILAAVAAVSVCGQAEIALEQHDPPSVVLDEIVAVPWCFFLPLLTYHAATPPMPLAMAKESIAGFLLFRLFDIVKPPPIRQLQKLPGGLGVVADDLGAALASGVVLWGLGTAGWIG